jgi:hypothetical protein
VGAGGGYCRDVGTESKVGRMWDQTVGRVGMAGIWYLRTPRVLVNLPEAEAELD